MTLTNLTSNETTPKVGALPIGLVPGAPQPAPRWSAAWRVAMQSPSDPLVAYPYVVPRLDGVTLRQSVRLGSAGEGARIWLSNEYGERPLHIGAAHFAPAGAAGRHAGPGQTITFSGRQCVVIPPGTRWVSDPFTLALSEDANCLVSLFIEQADEGCASLHRSGGETGWLSAPGNFAMHEAFVPDSILDCRYILCGVDVLNASTPSVLVAIGDSITDGDGSSPNTYGRWTDQAAVRLRMSPAKLCVVNHGIGGGRLRFPAYGDALLARFDRDVLAVPGAAAVIVLCGLNDLYLPFTLRSPAEVVDAAAICEALAQVRDRARGAGLAVFAGTLTPAGGSSGLFEYFSVTGESHREEINRWLRMDSGFDGIADFDAALRDPDDPTRLLTRFDSGDHLHPSDMGYAAMADVVVDLFADRTG